MSLCICKLVFTLLFATDLKIVLQREKLKVKVDPVVEILESEPVKAMMDSRELTNNRILEYVTTNHGVILFIKTRILHAFLLEVIFLK